ncbi:MAG: glycosyltransferase, partial [Pseudomonadota bacterium]
MNASGLSAELPNITVVIVTYRSSDVISDCLTSLIASAHPRLRIVVVDNASPDDTVTRINIWADGMGIDVEERSDRDRPGRPGGEQIYL